MKKQKNEEELGNVKKQREMSKMKDLPPFPEEGMKESRFTLGDEEEEIDSETLGAICEDIISIPFEVWAILKPGTEPLSSAEKKMIAKPLSRIVVKYDVAKFMKDEFLLIAALGFAILKRVKMKKVIKNAHNDSGEKREGKDYSGSEPSPAVSS